MPSIDVVIPNYQYGRYLPGCVASILAQGIPDTRILIIDNASTDNSVEVAQEIARQDARVELVVRSTNLGPHASFNEGLDWARARYFMMALSGIRGAERQEGWPRREDAWVVEARW